MGISSICCYGMVIVTVTVVVLELLRIQGKARMLCRLPVMHAFHQRDSRSDLQVDT